MLVACGTRTQHRMAVNIEDAGFEIRDVISWHYGEGFPKSMDISKQIDKMNGKHEVDLSAFGNYIKATRKSRFMTLSKLDELMGTNTAASWWEGRKDGVQLPSKSTYAKLKVILNLDNRFDDLINWSEAEREKIGEKKSGLSEGTGNSVGKFTDNRNEKGFVDITAPSTQDAKLWDGWGTALKPGTEFWTLARKPISESTIAGNVLKWGVGALNIDACRIAFRDDQDFNSATFGTGTNIMGGNYAGGNHTIDSVRKNIEANRAGRFPANVILDEFMAAEMDEQSGHLKAGGSVSGKEPSTPAKNVYGEYGRHIFKGHGDSGGASRFFYVAKPSAEERKAYNNHPTVKPLALMHYLIKMICPIEPGRVVLDPFAGSGTTLIAARQLGLDFVAYEMEANHIPIIEQRLKDFLGLFA